MSFDQKNGQGVATPPVNESSPLNGPSATVGNFAALGIDNLLAAAVATYSGQHPAGGAMPIVAPAAQQPTTFARMQAAKRWLLWDREKKPYYANGTPRHGTLDSDADRAALATFDEVTAALANSGGRFAGLGFALGPDEAGGYWQGIDLDKISKNQLEDLALAAPGYVERSPSGTGGHAIGYGRHFATLGPNGSGIEAYAGGRYFTVTSEMARDPELTCLADFVATAVVSRHSRTGSVRPQASGTVQIDPRTVTDLREALMHLRSDDRELWVAMGHALKELGDTGRGMWLVWSQTSNKFDPKDAAMKWDSFNPQNTGYQAVFAAAQRQGWINPNSNVARAAARPIDSTRRFSLLTDGDLQNLPPQRWLVKSIIPDSGVGVIYGDSGTFKSFLTLDLLAHIANGQPWFGSRVTTAQAAYVPFEGQGGIPKRVQAWRLAISHQAQRDVSTDIRFITDRMNLRYAADRDTLVATLLDNGWKGGVLCIDTLAQAGPGIDENTSQGMGEMISIFQELQHRLGGVVLVVHHSGKNASAGLRGWSGLRGAMDFAIKCWRGEDSPPLEGRFTLDKVKDDRDGVTYPFTMLRVSLGYDVDGDEITSLAVWPLAKTGDAEAEAKAEAEAVRPDVVERHAAEDDFVWKWIKETVEAGNFPSASSLEGKRDQIAGQFKMTQKQLRDAIWRLKEKSRIVPEGSGKTSWLRPIDQGIEA